MRQTITPKLVAKVKALREATPPFSYSVIAERLGMGKGAVINIYRTYVTPELRKTDRINENRVEKRWKGDLDMRPTVPYIAEFDRSPYYRQQKT